jgi:hypothetical protein
MLFNVVDIKAGKTSIPLVQTSLQAATSVGFVHEATLQMMRPPLGNRQVFEPILVFRKDGGHCSMRLSPLPIGPTRKRSYNTTVEGLTADALRHLYCVDLLPDSVIARKFGVSDALISQQRKRFAIATITARQREELRNPSGLSLRDLTADRLRELYTTLSDSQIATLYSTSKVTIRNRRHEFGIEAISKTERVKHGSSNATRCRRGS